MINGRKKTKEVNEMKVVYNANSVKKKWIIIKDQ